MCDMEQDHEAWRSASRTGHLSINGVAIILQRAVVGEHGFRWRTFLQQFMQAYAAWVTAHAKSR
jgi:hypothetical protein